MYINLATCVPKTLRSRKTIYPHTVHLVIVKLKTLKTLQNEVHIGGFREKLPLNDSKKVLKSILCPNALRDGGGGGGEMGLG